MPEDPPISPTSAWTSLPAVVPSTADPVAKPDDCWNRIGVYGDRLCVELIHHVHCRNCPVYSAAAASILDRPLPPDYRQDWSGHFALEKKRTAPGTLSVVIFRIRDEWLALPTGNFQEVVEERRVHSLPHRRDGVVLGIINVRGELLVCVSLGRLLGIPAEDGRGSSNSLSRRLAVAEWQGSLVTFPVSEVHGVHRFNPEQLRPAPATVAKASPNFTRGLLPWEDRLVGFLDEDAVFSTLNRNLS